jgi:superfamily II DNA or RNA helicase
LLEIVEEPAQNGWKVIVFSYFLDVLAAMHRAIGAAAMGPLTGSSSPRGKQDLVNLFTRTSGHAVLLSQIEAGGVGLNIQAASVVIIAEPQWKPSVEEQAIGRAHRMGQTRKVHVHRLLAKDSVDERMRRLCTTKPILFDAYVRKSDAKEANPRAVDHTLPNHTRCSTKRSRRRKVLLPWSGSGWDYDMDRRRVRTPTGQIHGTRRGTGDGVKGVGPHRRMGGR